MRTFQEFSLICEAIYDRDRPSDVPLEVGKIGRERKKTAPERRRTKAIGGGKTAPAKSYKPRKDIGKQRKSETRVQQPEKERGSAALSAKEVAFVPPLLTGTVSLRVEPAAVTVIAAEPSKSTPLIALAVASIVADAALPVKTFVDSVSNPTLLRTPPSEYNSSSASANPDDISV